MTARLLQHLQTEQAPAVGFVNEAKLYREGSLDPARVDLLRSWLKPTLNWATIRLPCFTQPGAARRFRGRLLQGETVTRPLMQSEGRTLRWFRHPYLHQGTTPRCALPSRTSSRRTATRWHGNREQLGMVFAVALFPGAGARRQRPGAAHRRSVCALHGPRVRTAEKQALELFGRPIPMCWCCTPTRSTRTISRARHHAAAARLPLVTLDDAIQGQRYASAIGYQRIQR